MPNSCVFCDIVNKKLTANIVYEDQKIIAFKDLHPKATTHLLFVPKTHIASLLDMETNHMDLIGYLFYKVADFAKTVGINGFKTIINTGKSGGQEVFHLHIHLLANQILPNFSI